MIFGEAVELARQGKLITRSGWNGKGMFIFIRPEDSLTVEFCVNTMKSLPPAVKEYLENRKTAIPVEKRLKAETPIKFTAYFCMKAADDSIVNGWLASQTDMLADDWQLFEP